MESREIRIPVTKLKDHLNEVGIKIQVLCQMTGITAPHLYKALSGEVDYRTGSVRMLSRENIELLQEALHQMSLKLKYIFIFYNTDLEVCKQNGRRYCPDCVQQIKQQLSPFISVLTFLQYALGWNRSKVSNVMTIKTSPAYGNISQDDVNQINIKLAEIATRLDMLTLTQS